MKSKKILRTPLIISAEPSQSVGGIADNPSVDDYGSQTRRYHSFDTFTENDKVNDEPYKAQFGIKGKKDSIILDVLIAVILFIISTTVIILSSIAHQNKYDNIIYINLSNMILSISISSCVLLCAVWKLITICYFAQQEHCKQSALYIFCIISCTVSLFLSILSFLKYYISYPLWLNIVLVSYSFCIISSIIIIQLLPPNHFANIDISLDVETPHKNAPQYIHKYGTLHPYDRSLLKKIWHSVTHHWLWNIINLGYKKPLQIYDCYQVPKSDHILTQYEVWDKYLKTVGFDCNNFSTFKCVWQLEGRAFITRGVIYMAALITSLSVPFIISALSDFYEDKSIAINVGIYLSLGLWIVAFVRIEIVALIMTMTSLIMCIFKYF